MADPVLNDLQQMYLPLVGKEFQGTYVGAVIMPHTGNLRDIISVSVAQGDFATILSGVSHAVRVLQSTSGKLIWKGITGPDQSPYYTDYWLWVEPDFHGVLEMSNPYNFQITQCTPFVCGGGVFSHGVNIKASVIPSI